MKRERPDHANEKPQANARGFSLWSRGTAIRELVSTGEIELRSPDDDDE